MGFNAAAMGFKMTAMGFKPTARGLEAGAGRKKAERVNTATPPPC